MIIPRSADDQDQALAIAGYIRQDHTRYLRDLKIQDDYYEGKQKLAYLDPALLETLNDRIRMIVINWPRLVVDSVADRLEVKGFRLPSAVAADDQIEDIWQSNDLDEYQDDVHLDAFIYGRSYVIIGAGEDYPLVTAESPLEVHSMHHPATRAVSAAIKQWKDEDQARWCTLYLPDETWSFHAIGSQWELVNLDRHRFGDVPVVPFINRSRTRAPQSYGVSELADVMGISDAANKTATDMMVSAEYHAMPRRVAYGFEEKDFQDSLGRRVNRWAREAMAMWFTKRKPSEAKIEQLPEADLTNFHNTINQLARVVSALAALPPHYLGFSTEIPASADAIRSSESRLVKKAEKRQLRFGGKWEKSMRIARRFATDGAEPAEYRRLKAMWVDAATPTISQRSDAAVKLHQAGITTRRQAREDLGYDKTDIERMENDDRRDALNDAVRVGAGPANEFDQVPEIPDSRETGAELVRA